MIKDTYGRSFKKLRISLTQVCNIACTYCVPEGKPVNNTTGNLASANDLVKMVKKIHAVNPLEVVRLTGGEPLLYQDLPYLIESLQKLGIQVKMTTNALLLKKKLPELINAGLHSINISLDALDPNIFFKITRSLKYKEVLDGIDLALQHLLDVKLNAVIVRGVNEKQILPLLQFAGEKKISIRFLELMQMGHLFAGGLTNLVSEEEILNIIQQQHSIFPLERTENATSNYWITDNLIKFGIISNHSQPFCSDCDRLRLDSQGNIYGCISSELGYSIIHADEETIREKLRLALKQKKMAFTGSSISMKYIGG